MVGDPEHHFFNLVAEERGPNDLETYKGSNRAALIVILGYLQTIETVLIDLGLCRSPKGNHLCSLK